MSIDDFTAPAVAALATALVTTTVVSISQWLNSRGQERRGQVQLDLAAKQLAVLSSVVSLQAQLDPHLDPAALRTQLGTDLAAAIESVRRAQPQVERAGPRVTPRRLSNAILLADVDRGLLAKSLRAAYWLALTVALIIFAIIVSVPFDPQPDQDPSDVMIGLTFFLCLAAALASALRHWTRRCALRAGTVAAQGQPAPGAGAGMAST